MPLTPITFSPVLSLLMSTAVPLSRVLRTLPGHIGA
jgi:hypothetical protein